MIVNLLTSQIKLREYLPRDWQKILQRKFWTIPHTLVKDKIIYRRKRVFLLAIRGLTQKEISKMINCSLSTIEKDFNAIREGEIFL